MKALSDLTEREVLALAIANEEEDSRIYQSFADRLRSDFGASAHVFEDMAEEERGHRDSLYGLYRERFGQHLPPIRREDVRGFLKRRTPWWEPSLNLDKMRGEAELMERQAANFYEQAASRATDVSLRQLFTHLAEVERGHERRAEEIAEAHLTERHAGRRGERPPARLRPAIRAAGARRPDRRLGLDPGAALRRRLRHAQQLGDLSRRARRLGRRRHQHGLHRSALRRRHHHGTRIAGPARRRLRADDGRRRHRPHACPT